jgi:hypothetical protein
MPILVRSIFFSLVTRCNWPKPPGAHLRRPTNRRQIGALVRTSKKPDTHGAVRNDLLHGRQERRLSLPDALIADGKNPSYAPAVPSLRARTRRVFSPNDHALARHALANGQVAVVRCGDFLADRVCNLWAVAGWSAGPSHRLNFGAPIPAPRWEGITLFGDVKCTVASPRTPHPDEDIFRPSRQRAVTPLNEPPSDFELSFFQPLPAHCP